MSDGLCRAAAKAEADHELRAGDHHRIHSLRILRPENLRFSAKSVNSNDTNEFVSFEGLCNSPFSFFIYQIECVRMHTPSGSCFLRLRNAASALSSLSKTPYTAEPEPVICAKYARSILK